MELKPASPVVPRIVLGALAAIVLSIFAAINIQSQKRVQALIQNGKKTIGVVTAKNCSNHGEIGYSVSINTQELHARGFGCVQSCADATIGAPVEVTYIESKPPIVQCGAIDQEASRINGNFIGLFIAALFLAIAIYHITKVKNVSAIHPNP